jgi:catechol-2,3-dioxygenase
MSSPLPVGPLQVSEIILRTARFDEMKSWYQILFGGLEPSVETATRRQMKSVPHIERLCFLRIHVAFPYTQVLGLFEVPEATPARGMVRGLDHMQFREQGLEELFQRYEHLKAFNIRPTQSFNHGPSTSFYYADPDDNVVELSAVNFPNEKDYLAFFQSAAFKQNVEGDPIDTEHYIAECRQRAPA